MRIVPYVVRIAQSTSNFRVPAAVKHNGNLTLDTIIAIARQMRHRSMSKRLEGTVKEILGTCQSVGCTVDAQHPHDIIQKIRDGDIKVPAE